MKQKTQKTNSGFTLIEVIIVTTIMSIFSIFLVNGPELRICQNPALNLQKLNAVGNLLVPEERQKLSYIDLCLNDVVVQEKERFSK